MFSSARLCAVHFNATEVSFKCASERLITVPVMRNCFRTNNWQHSASLGQLSPPTDTIHTISINNTAINSCVPNRQPNSRSAETQTLPLNPFFSRSEMTPPGPRLQRLSFPFLSQPKLRTPISFRREGTNRNPEEVTSTVWSRDNGTGLDRR